MNDETEFIIAEIKQRKAQLEAEIEAHYKSCGDRTGHEFEFKGLGKVWRDSGSLSNNVYFEQEFVCQFCGLRVLTTVYKYDSFEPVANPLEYVTSLIEEAKKQAEKHASIPHHPFVCFPGYYSIESSSPSFIVAERNAMLAKAVERAKEMRRARLREQHKKDLARV